MTDRIDDDRGLIARVEAGLGFSVYVGCSRREPMLNTPASASTD